MWKVTIQTVGWIIVGLTEWPTRWFYTEYHANQFIERLKRNEVEKFAGRTTAAWAEYMPDYCLLSAEGLPIKKSDDVYVVINDDDEQGLFLSEEEARKHGTPVKLWVGGPYV